MGTLLHSYAKVREPIELLFGVVNDFGLGIRVLDGGRRILRERGEFLDRFPPLAECFQWPNFHEKCGESGRPSILLPVCHLGCGRCRVGGPQ